jgi:hypothetical protein
MMKVEEELESLFLVKGYHWNIGGNLIIPNADDIRMLIDKAKAELSDEPDNTQLQVGRLIIKKQNGHYDVYVMIGEASE